MNLAATRSGLPTFDENELIQCISRLIQIDQEWVPHSESSTLYIRPTLIATEVSISEMNLVIIVNCVEWVCQSTIDEFIFL